ncbi:MAG: DUF1501 domain-containing protein [Armatimonadetes bacterium]|nr:DUF1501 domain-containing protein [Armatimonadota bacterium]
MTNDIERFACPEYRSVSRRSFLGGATMATMAAGLGYAWLPRVAFAESASQRDLLVSVFLRGGADGCTLCVPYGDPGYYLARPTIAIPRPDSGQSGRATDLNGFFGLPTELTPLLPAYQNGHLAIVHAVGSQNWSRSHFDAQAWMELSDRGHPSNTTGWIGRHLATTGEALPGSPLRGIAFNYGMVRIMNGGPKSLPIADPASFGYQAWYPNLSEILGTIEDRYRRLHDAQRQAVQDTNATIAALDAIDFEGYQAGGGAVYPEDGFGRALKSVAAMYRADMGLEAAHIDMDGWDTHAQQGPIGGYMAGLMDTLGKSLAAFYTDLTAVGKTGFTLVLVSEFGRNVLENGSEGTDHGAGNCMLVMGGAVNGGQVFGTWPGCGTGQLLDGYDLQMTTDYRSVLAEVVEKRLQNPNLGAVFPDFSPNFLGVCHA